MTQSETIINSPGELPVQDGTVLDANIEASTEANPVPSSRAVGISEVKPDSWYARYVLGVLLLVYIFNFIDRQVLAILAEDIKADLGVTDAQLGFLYGTAFAVFYATFGMAFGRLADCWDRKKLISLGLGFWSVMTAMSGLARGFLPLAACRFGVGVGEASASPAAYSILYDYFSPRVRTTVMSVYATGISIGAGLGLLIGGVVLDGWNSAFPDPALAPFGLKGWQATFMAVGLPGLVLALWASTLREPIRGMSDGVTNPPHPHPFRETAHVFLSMVPVANWPGLGRGHDGSRAVAINIMAAIAIISLSAAIIHFTGDALQWIALGIGFYAVFSWAQGIKVKDPVIFGLMFKCRSFLLITLGGGAVTFMGAGVGFWLIPFLQRNFAVSASEAGMTIGIAGAVLGILGKVGGGVLADWLRTRIPRGKAYTYLGGMGVSVVFALFYLNADTLPLVYAGFFVAALSGAMAFGPWISMVNDLMIPRGRATASAFAYMSNTMIGISLGPYVVGRLSDMFAAGGLGDGESLRQAMVWALLLAVVGVAMVTWALRYLVHDEANLFERARALGEKI